MYNILFVLSKKVCEKCQYQSTMSRVQPAAIIKVTLFWLPVQTYQCNCCGKKTYTIGPLLSVVKPKALKIV